MKNFNMTLVIYFIISLFFVKQKLTWIKSNYSVMVN